MSDTVHEELSPEEQKFVESGGEEGDIGSPRAQPEPERRQEAPAAEPDPEDDARPDERGEDRVPLASLLKERAEAKAARKEAQSLRESQARLDERLNLLREAMQPAPQQPQATPPEERIPAFEEDPKGYIEGNLARIRRETDAMAQFRQQVEQGGQQQRQMQELAGIARHQYQSFLAQNPEGASQFSEAIRFLSQSRTDELSTFGLTPQQIQAQLSMDDAALAQASRQGGPSYPERLIGLAKLRGWQKQDAPAEEEPRIERVAEGQRRAAPAMGSGGAPRSSLPSAAALANMSDREFDKLVSSLKGDPDKMAALFGR